jgi:hypothetical protein
MVRLDRNFHGQPHGVRGSFMPITCLVGRPLARWSRAYALGLILFFFNSMISSFGNFHELSMRVAFFFFFLFSEIAAPGAYELNLTYIILHI